MENRTYKILLDGEWSLEDLMNFSRIYFQNYSFLYCLEHKAIGIAPTRMESVLKNYELRHGLSYVNIYDIFRTHIPKEDKPQINSMQYASPGWLDLVLNPDVAVQFAKVMGVFISGAGSVVGVAEVYKKLYRIYADLSATRKKLGLTTFKLQAQEALAAQKLNSELAKGLGFESLADLDAHTKDVEESSKLLMAHYRRMQKMAKFVKDGKASFPESGS
ncbi:hypothetical protein J3L16_15805 [Alteromonas sp. 5E99-2]|uniref:hypothetical protein n=1 Tax=Alteromonas sp. 5E99-2 TaxID=2817683 RepID=UPI001A996C30|nr:hypothetical protein [Alteromonas sp. 5E99-2]MBO1257147.1 hypothetical protein [Alteromonas sp. 5E99-2]